MPLSDVPLVRVCLCVISAVGRTHSPCLWEGLPERNAGSQTRGCPALGSRQYWPWSAAAKPKGNCRVEAQTPWRPMAEEAPKENPQDGLVSDGGSPESWWVGGELDSSLLKELSVLTPPGPQAARLFFLGIKGLREAGSGVGGGPLRSLPA